ncbi:AMP-binding protein [bacterium]|nr:AMP-binding protein [bacterium]
MNLNYTLDQTVSEFGENIAFKHPGGEINYEMFHEAVKRLAQGLQKLGIDQGERVAIMLPNVPHFAISYFAILRLGAVVVPVNTMLKGSETAVLLEDSEAKVLIIWEGLYSEISRAAHLIHSLKHLLVLGSDIPENSISLTRLISRCQPINFVTDVEEEDLAVIQYTAGVTGRPKGVELSHGNYLSNVRECREIMRVTSEDEFLAVLPFFHSMGQTMSMILSLTSGACLNIFPRFDPEEVLNTLINGNSSLFVGVPSMFKLVYDLIAGEDELEINHPIRLCICGGGGISEELLKQFEKTFHTYILESYTTAETSPVISFNQWRTGRRVGSLGHPIPGVEMKVVDENNEEVSIGEAGEIVVKGPNVMRGYLNRPRLSEQVLEYDWFHTSDLGKMDINGFFYLVDRQHDRIIKGGFSIYPSEVEAILIRHPDVMEVAVVPIPDEIMGQEVKACIVLKESATVTTEQLADYCREHMALYKVPAIVRFYLDFPRTATGRIDKRELRN